MDVEQDTESTSVRVAGRLEEATAQELFELCRRRTGVLVVDLAELVSADRAAIEVLKDLRDAGARIAGASPYIRMLLNGGAHPDGPPAASHDKEEEE